MVSVIKKLDFLRQSIVFPRYSFTGLDHVQLELEPKEKLGILFNDIPFLLEHNESGGDFELNSLNANGEKILLNNNSNCFQKKVSDTKAFWIMVDGRTVFIQGTGVLVFGQSVLQGVKSYKQNNKGSLDPIGGHRIGTLYNPKTGHVIDGGRLYEDTENGIRPPFIVVDFERDVELKKAYKNITSDLGLEDSSESQSVNEDTLLKRVYDEFKDLKYLYDCNPLKEKLKKINRGIRVGPLVSRLGGICCYQAYIVCAILEKLILNKHFSGRVFYGHAKDHSWPLYISESNNELYILDSTQRKFANLRVNPNELFFGVEEVNGKEVEKWFKYLDFLPPEFLLMHFAPSKS